MLPASFELLSAMSADPIIQFDHLVDDVIINARSNIQGRFGFNHGYVETVTVSQTEFMAFMAFTGPVETLVTTHGPRTLASFAFNIILSYVD